jgi:hypothetical protein
MYVFAPYGINIMIISVDVVFVLVFPGYVVVWMLALVAAMVLMFSVDPWRRLLLILPTYFDDSVFCFINFAMCYSYMSSALIFRHPLFLIGNLSEGKAASILLCSFATGS